MRRIPVLATLLVVVAIGVMITLGVWQLGRAQQKEALLASYAAVGGNTAEVPFPATAKAAEPVLFRRSRVDCRPSGPDAPVAGHNAAGTTGWAHAFICPLPGGGSAEVLIGWSKDLQPRVWSGGVVTGTVALGAGETVRLIADPPLAGLDANARPDPASIPNNHLSYAIQWFLFALTALVIYAIALRKRMAL